MRHKKFGNSPESQLNGDLDDLDARIRRLENVNVPTLPLYDQPGYLTGDAVEGQLVIDTAVPGLKFRYNNAWHDVSSVSDGDLGVSYYDTNPVATVTSKHYTFIPMTRTQSDTTPKWNRTTNSPWMTCLVAGLYAINYEVVPQGTPDATKWWEVDIGFSPAASFFNAENLPMTSTKDSGGSVITSFWRVSRQFIQWFDAGDIFAIAIYHEKSSSDTFYVSVKMRQILK